jgi:hypothetical protein
MFLAFGSLLGYMREGRVIPWDSDMDLGVLRRLITPAQEDEYVRLIGEPAPGFETHGLKYARWAHNKAHDKWHGGRYAWLSIKGHEQHGIKCCHWFFFERKGYAWHWKGLPTALIKGIPAEYVGIGPEVEYLGQRVHIPAQPGACLDWWYPDWGTPRHTGNSSCRLLAVTNDWTNEAAFSISDDPLRLIK